MKNGTKKILSYLTFIALYLLQALSYNSSFSYVYFFGFVAAVLLLYIIKNKYLGFLSGVTLLFAMDLFNTDYKQLTVLAFILICTHKNLASDISLDKSRKKRSNGFFSLCIQTAIFTTIILFIYDFILLSQLKPSTSLTTFSRVVFIFLWLIGLCLYSFSSKNKQVISHMKSSKDILNNFRFIYLISIFSFIATVLFAYAKAEYIDIHYNAIFFPWFVYICSLFYNDDIYIKTLEKSIESLLEKISVKNMVK